MTDGYGLPLLGRWTWLHLGGVSRTARLWILIALLSPGVSTAAVSGPVDGARPGGLLIVAGDGAATRYAPQLGTLVRIDVSAVLARAHVRQRFVNPATGWVEGLYTFPLPDNAAVDRLRMRIGERIIEGEIRERATAERNYREARDRGQAASLVRQRRPNIFTTAVANIPPGGAVEIEITYQQRLKWREGRFSLRFPTVVAPRYIPGRALAAESGVATGDGTGWAEDTDLVPDASSITPPVAIDGPAGFQRFALTARIGTGFPVAGIRSLSHAVSIGQSGPGQFEVRLKDEGATADRDFVLEWRPVAARQPRLALFGETWRGRHYALLMLMPPSSELAAGRLDRELVLVIDTSGSMHGKSLAQAKRAVAKALSQLGAGDRFNLIQFSDRVGALFDRSRPAGADTLRRAREFLAGLSAEGGTEMGPALAYALKDPIPSDLLRQVVFLTDGAVGNEQALFGLIERELGKSRLFTVGIGAAPNGYFMRRAARFGRGTYTFIGSAADVDDRVGELFDALRRPVLTDLAVDWQLPPGVAQAEPAIRSLPDLYSGEPLVVAAVSDAAPLAVAVSGRAGRRTWTEQRDFRQAAAGSGLHALWARRRVAAWLDAGVSGIDPQRIRDEVVRLGLDHHLVTPHTSLVAVDRTPRRAADAALARGIIPTRLPAGWSAPHVFGQLPATATPGPLLAIGGLALLVTALGLGLVPYARCVCDYRPSRH